MEKDGVALQNEFISLAEQLGFDAQPFTTSTPLEYTQACSNYDVVVVDASVSIGISLF
ncbi:MAG: hypothetical protein ACRC1Z_12085 [Waterburya sp.]